MEWKFAGFFFKGMKKTLVIGEGAHKWNPCHSVLGFFSDLELRHLSVDVARTTQV